MSQFKKQDPYKRVKYYRRWQEHLFKQDMESFFLELFEQSPPRVALEAVMEMLEKVLEKEDISIRQKAVSLLERLLDYSTTDASVWSPEDRYRAAEALDLLNSDRICHFPRS